MNELKREKVNVVFVCTGNTCRSPMAEQIFIDWLKRNKCASVADVSSAGLYADNGLPMTPEAAAALMGLGMTVRPHKSRLLTIDVLQNADIIVCMTEQHRNALLSARTYAFASGDGQYRVIGTVAELIGDEVSDPYGKGMDEYNRAAELLVKMCEPLYGAVMDFRNNHKLPL